MLPSFGVNPKAFMETIKLTLNDTSSSSENAMPLFNQADGDVMMTEFLSRVDVKNAILTFVQDILLKSNSQRYISPGPNFSKLNSNSLRLRKSEQSDQESQRILMISEEIFEYTKVFSSAMARRENSFGTFGTVNTDDPGGNCFSGSCKVKLKDGTAKLMSDLCIGDFVQTVSENGRIDISEVVFFAHCDQHSFSEYYQISIENGSSVNISALHFIPISNDVQDTFDAAIYTTANNLSVGDLIWTIVDDRVSPKPVTKINVVQDKGIFFPLLSNNQTVVVDNIVCCIFSKLNDKSMFSNATYLSILNIASSIIKFVYRNSTKKTMLKIQDEMQLNQKVPQLFTWTENVVLLFLFGYIKMFYLIIKNTVF
jgi:hypothetical protein